MDLNTSGTMELSLQAQADARVTVDKAKRGEEEKVRAIARAVPAPVPRSHYLAKAKPTTAQKHVASSSAKRAATPSKTTAKSASSSALNKSSISIESSTTSPTFGGCSDVEAGLSANAGADADFLKLFNTNTQVALFSKISNCLRNFSSPSPPPPPLPWLTLLYRNAPAPSEIKVYLSILGHCPSRHWSILPGSHVRVTTSKAGVGAPVSVANLKIGAIK